MKNIKNIFKDEFGIEIFDFTFSVNVEKELNHKMKDKNFFLVEGYKPFYDIDLEEYMKEYEFENHPGGITVEFSTPQEYKKFKDKINLLNKIIEKSITNLQIKFVNNILKFDKNNNDSIEELDNYVIQYICKKLEKKGN